MCYSMCSSFILCTVFNTEFYFLVDFKIFSIKLFKYLVVNNLFIYRYKSGSLTSVFLDRVFQDAFTYDGEMDYKGYLNFVLATENRHEPQALRYLFRFLDIKNQGYLDSFTILYFSRVIYYKYLKSKIYKLLLIF